MEHAINSGISCLWTKHLQEEMHDLDLEQSEHGDRQTFFFFFYYSLRIFLDLRFKYDSSVSLIITEIIITSSKYCLGS